MNSPNSYLIQPPVEQTVFLHRRVAGDRPAQTLSGSSSISALLDEGNISRSTMDFDVFSVIKMTKVLFQGLGNSILRCAKK